MMHGQETPKKSSVYDCTVEDVDHIYNTLRLYFCCWMCILSVLLLFFLLCIAAILLLS